MTMVTSVQHTLAHLQNKVDKDKDEMRKARQRLEKKRAIQAQRWDDWAMSSELRDQAGGNRKRFGEVGVQTGLEEGPPNAEWETMAAASDGVPGCSGCLTVVPHVQCENEGASADMDSHGEGGCGPAVLCHQDEVDGMAHNDEGGMAGDRGRNDDDGGDGMGILEGGVTCSGNELIAANVRGVDGVDEGARVFQPANGGGGNGGGENSNNNDNNGSGRSDLSGELGVRATAVDDTSDVEVVEDDAQRLTAWSCDWGWL